MRFQYPVGPVCDWPDIIDCILACPEDGECQGNADCDQCGGGYCNLDCSCTYSPPCGCTEDSDCNVRVDLINCVKLSNTFRLETSVTLTPMLARKSQMSVRLMLIVMRDSLESVPLILMVRL